MRVTFVLPGYSTRPIGGYLVVFNYANELSRRGHEVTVVHAEESTVPESLLAKGRSVYRYRRKRGASGDGRPSWFDLDPDVRVKVMREISRRVPDGDAVFATACTTARPVFGLHPRKGAKFYLIQGYEDWACGQREVDATWLLPMHKVVSSRWLEEIGIGLGEMGRLTRVPLGVEHDTFHVRVEPASRNPLRVGMLGHSQPDKGMAYGITALELARQRLPDLDAVVFGARSRPRELASWIEYVENPTRPELADLYNSLSVFLHTSITEGWGLTGAEAIACGCALVASDSGGVRDFGIDGETALLVPPRDPRALASQLVRLMSDDVLRGRLARGAIDSIQKFTWEGAATRLEEVITPCGPTNA